MWKLLKEDNEEKFTPRVDNIEDLKDLGKATKRGLTAAQFAKEHLNVDDDTAKKVFVKTAELSKKSSENLDDLKSGIGHAFNSVKDTIGDHPIASGVVGAIGAGLGALALRHHLKKIKEERSLNHVEN